MGKIWVTIVLTSCVLCVTSGRSADTSRALLESGTKAVMLLLELSGGMALWSGLMELLCASGDVAKLGRFLRRVLRPLFPGITDDAAWSAMSMNMAANIFGLGNAATPAGIEAARLLAAQGEAGVRALSMLLVLNNSSLQLIPATVMTLRSAAGAVNPADIWGPTLLSSGAATATAAVLMALVNRRQRG